MIKILSFIISFVLLDACFQIGPKFFFEIKNDSSYPIVIKAYYKGKLNEKIEIESKESYIEKTNSSGEHLTPLNNLSDSIVVVFDNRKAIIQYCEGRPLVGTTPICGEIEDNLSDFNFGIYKSGNLFHGSSMKITFDNLDFERALAL